MRREFADIHSHILPGVDDGAADETQAIFALKQMEKLGVTDLILTPHYCRRRGYVKSVEDITKAYEKFKETCKCEGIGVRLYLGTEMEYSNDAVRYIKEGRVNTLASGKYILVEFPPYVKQDTILKASKEITQLGLIPIIAHIERYESILRDFKAIYEIKNTGAQIQLNIHSVCSGKFKMKRFMKKVISEKLADFVAGDVHSSPITEETFDKCCSFIIKHSSEKYLESLLFINAKNIINGR